MWHFFLVPWQLNLKGEEGGLIRERGKRRWSSTVDSILVLPKKLCTLLSIFICPTNHCTQEAALFSKSFNLYSSCSGHALKMYSVKTGFFFSILHCYILSFFILKDHINVLGVLGSPGTSLQLRLMLGVFSNANDIVIPPNSNTLSDWRKTCHVQWIKTL